MRSNCTSKGVVIVQSGTDFGGITQANCTSNGVVFSDSAAASGSASSVVFVTVCYPWDFGGKLPMLKMGNLVNGAFLMQASTAFRAEPYN